jgi:hypothetical protein
MLRAGATAKEMAPALGYKTAKGVQKYLRAVGLPLPFIKDKSGNRKPRSDAERQAQADRMRAYHKEKQDGEGASQDRHRVDQANG